MMIYLKNNILGVADSSLQSFASIATPLLLLFGMMLAYLLAIRWMKDRSHLAAESTQLALRGAQAFTRQSAIADSTLDHSGYVIMRMSDRDKPIFLDLLRGFEDFAQLKGYRLSFAFDGSMTDRVAFRFTILEGGLLVSSDQVKSDLRDYMNRVQTGSGFDDIVPKLPPEQHHGIVTILQNRLLFLQTAYSAQRNLLKTYQAFGSSLSNLPTAAPNHIFIQNAGTVNPAQYTAINSPQAAQGQNIQLIRNVAETEIRIGETLAERREISDKLDRLSHALIAKQSSPEIDNKAWAAHKLVAKIQDEITDQPKPDESRIRKYLEGIKNIFSTITFAKEAIDAFQELIKIMNA